MRVRDHQLFRFPRTDRESDDLEPLAQATCVGGLLLVHGRQSQSTDAHCARHHARAVRQPPFGKGRYVSRLERARLHGPPRSIEPSGSRSGTPRPIDKGALRALATFTIFTLSVIHGLTLPRLCGSRYGNRRSNVEDFVKLTLFLVGGLLILLSALSRMRSARWWIRFADFPRIQIAVGLAAVLVLHTILYKWDSLTNVVFAVVVLAALIYQGLRIFPYTVLATKEACDARSADSARSIRILASNVLMENRQADRLLALIRSKEPDLVLAVETDDWWYEQLKVLDGDFPYRLKQPQGNHYGLHFFSKLELRSPELRFLVEDAIPSVRTGVRLRSGDWIEFYGLHPRPPEVQEDTEQRDAEILIVGREIRADGRPSIVAGDLNDVAWSHTTRMFQRISGTLDPRRGRGTFNTFHAQYPMFRWPLDHIFHEASFTLIRLERLPSIGSDHFPVLAELHYEPAAEARQDTPEPDRKDLKEAQDKIEDGKEAAEQARR